MTGPKLVDDAVSSRTLADSSVGLEHLKRPVVAAGVVIPERSDEQVILER